MRRFHGETLDERSRKSDVTFGKLAEWRDPAPSGMQAELPSRDPNHREGVNHNLYNGFSFCMKSHAAAARAWLGTERSTALDHLLATEDAGGFTPKMQALLALSRALQGCVLGVTPEHVERARAAGAGDQDIHDTVLITAAFCMYNRYVEGLGTRQAADHEYEPMGRRLRDQGYAPNP